uniref:Uncharacterized protein n=1 Tax=Glossina palpalis gambiensis TaxID=67801 RepID=A0A1B0C4U4_9MUSC
MLTDVMANNVMLSKDQLFCYNQSHFEALYTDYCFELSPHDFGGPPHYIHQEQQHANDNTTAWNQNIRTIFQTVNDDKS